jgi:hypothetical protein
MALARCGGTSMSAKVTDFLTEWLNRHAVGRIASNEDIPAMASRCLDDASWRGISKRDIEGVVGPVEDCIRMSLHQVKK